MGCLVERHNAPQRLVGELSELGKQIVGQDIIARNPAVYKLLPEAALEFAQIVERPDEPRLPRHGHEEELKDSAALGGIEDDEVWPLAPDAHEHYL